jgi:hypothetical protein
VSGLLTINLNWVPELCVWNINPCSEMIRELQFSIKVFLIRPIDLFLEIVKENWFPTLFCEDYKAFLSHFNTQKKRWQIYMRSVDGICHRTVKPSGSFE